MLAYRKSKRLRLRRFSRPEIPFWPATMIFPYGGHRSAPLSIDVAELTAAGIEKGEVEITQDIKDLLSREQLHTRFHDPVVIESAGLADYVFRLGEESAKYQLEQGSHVMQIISTEGSVPAVGGERFVLTIEAWPLDLGVLRSLFAEASEAGHFWGVWVPVVFPLTTDLDNLERLADEVLRAGGRFMASSSIDLSPTAKSAIARAGDARIDDDAYDVLFHSDTEALALATERHIAFLAHARGLADRIPDSRSSRKDNWAAASLLTCAGSRLARMRQDPESGWALIRSAGIIATLGKPISVVAESAPLSIIEGVDPLASTALESWLRGDSPSRLLEIDQAWRLRRDAGL